MAKFECSVCGYIFDEQQAGIKFSEIMECPICAESRDKFTRLEDEEAPKPAAPKAEEKKEEDKKEDASDASKDAKKDSAEKKEDSEKSEVKVSDAEKSGDDKGYVIEKRQEFWLEEKDKEKEVDKSNIQTYYEGAKPVKSQEQLDREAKEKEEKERPRLDPIDGSGAVQKVIEGGDRSSDGSDSEVVVVDTKAASDVDMGGDESEDDFIFEENTIESAEPLETQEIPASAGAGLNEGGDFFTGFDNNPNLGDKVRTEEFFFDDEEPVGEVVEIEEVAEEVVEETAEEVAEETAEEVAEETAEELVEETVEEAVEETVEEAVEEKAEEVAEEATEEKAEETAEETAEEATEEAAEEVVEEAAEEVAEETAEEAAEETAKEVAKEAAEEAAEEASEEVAEEKAEEAVEEAAEEVAEEAAEEAVEETAEETAEEAVEEATEGIAEDAVEEVTEEAVEEAIEETVEEAAEEAVEEKAEETAGVAVAAAVAAALAAEATEKAEEEPAEEVAEEAVEETAEATEETAEEATEETAAEATEETAEEATEEVAEEAVEDTSEEEKTGTAVVEDKKYSLLADAETKSLYVLTGVGPASNGLEGIILLPAQLDPMPMSRDEEINAGCVIGKGTGMPVKLDRPFGSTDVFLWGEYIPGTDNADELTDSSLVLVRGQSSHIPNVSGKEQLRREVAKAKDITNGTPVGISLVIGRIEQDLAACVYAGVDFVVLNDVSSGMLPYALRRAKNYLNHVNSEIELIVSIRDVNDAKEIAKLIALGADFILLEREYDEITTEHITAELKEIARNTGHKNVSHLNMLDICTIDSDLAANTDIAHF